MNFFGIKEAESNYDNRKSNLVDVPVKTKDLLNVNKYVSALCGYIKNAQTPTTIAIQGEWGAGKTSFLNLLKNTLCNEEENKECFFTPIWINMWRYALLNNPSTITTQFISGIINEIQRLAESKNYKITEHEGSFGILLKKMKVFAKTAAVFAVDTGVSYTTGGIVQNAGHAVGQLLPGDDKSDLVSFFDPEDFRKNFEDLVIAYLEEEHKKHPNNKGFIIFIDDLDRLDPPVAVKTLELMKNMFEVENCLFVLAIDYEVVVRGLEPRFGKKDATNERQFRSFFDKIIQLPFQMPVNAYQIDDYVSDALEQIGYYTKDELSETISDSSVLEQIIQYVEYSTGPNPRSMKRLFNSLSLIQIMHRSEFNSSEELTTKERLLNFALVCMQIAYPTIYNHLMIAPVFRNWDDEFARRARLDKLSDIEEADFDEDTEEWKKILYRTCKANSYMESRFINIVAILENIESLIDTEDNEKFESEIMKLMGISAVTGVAVEQKTEVKLTSGDELRIKFWEGLDKYIEQSDEEAVKKAKETWLNYRRKATGSNWRTYHARENFYIMLVQNHREEIIKVCIIINEKNHDLYKKFVHFKDKLAQDYGVQIDEWRDSKVLNIQDSSINCNKQVEGLTNQELWKSEALPWMVDTMVRMMNAFKEISKLPDPELPEK